MNPTEKDVKENWNNRSWWSKISRFQLPEEFIRKYKDKLDWNNITTNGSLSEDFIEENKCLINWNLVGMGQVLSEKFIERYKYEISWYDIIRYQDLSEKFIWDNRQRVSWDLVFQNQPVTGDFIEKCLEKIPELNTERIWGHICYFQILSEEFILRHEDKIQWNTLSFRQPFITKYKNDIIRSNIYKPEYENSLSKLYEKNSSWFICYTYIPKLVKNKKYIRIVERPINLVAETESIGKIRVHWKDLVLVNKVKKYEFIRTVKNIEE